jgi:glutaminyl-tRNA synthetase
MAQKGGDPAAIVARLGLEKVTDAGALEPVVDRVLEAWPEKVAEYRQGKTSLLGLFVGEVMKETQGAADPKLAKALLRERLEDGA